MNGERFFVLAVSTRPDGKRLEVFHSTPGKALGSPDCRFERRQVHQSQPTNVNRDYLGYPDNLSLFADTEGGVYLVGLGLYGLMWTGNEYADLFQLNLDVRRGRGIVTKLAHRRATCVRGASFRWGASARVVDAQTLQLIACEQNVQDRQRIAVNTFTRA